MFPPLHRGPAPENSGHWIPHTVWGHMFSCPGTDSSLTRPGPCPLRQVSEWVRGPRLWELEEDVWNRRQSRHTLLRLIGLNQPHHRTQPAALSRLSSPLRKQPAPFIPHRHKGGSQPGCLHKDTYSMPARWTGPARLSISSDWQVARSGQQLAGEGA